jgi:hypothetical protein
MRSTRSQITGLLVLLTVLCAARTEQSSAAAAQGPLRVHPENPRYFTDGTGRAVYLTGFQYWDVVREDGSPGPDAMEFTIESSGGPQRFKAPFAADAVLYLEKTNSRIGWSGQRADEPTAWAHQVDWPPVFGQ